MKRIIYITLLTLVSSFANDKIATVDMKKVFESYHKTLKTTEEYRTKLNEIESFKNQRAQQLKPEEEAFRQLEQNLRNLKGEELRQQQQLVRKQYLALDKKFKAFQTELNKRQRSFSIEERKANTALIKELDEEITKKYKDKYDIILNSTKFSGSSAVIFSNEKYDITDEVIKTLNEGHEKIVKELKEAQEKRRKELKETK